MNFPFKFLHSAFRYSVVRCLLLVSLAAPLYSQTRSPVDTLTLAQCLDRAIEQAPALKQYSILTQAAGITLEHDRALLKPQFESSFNTSSNTYNDFSYFYADGGVDLLLDLPKRQGNYQRIAELQRDQYSLYTVSEKMNITKEVKNIFYEIGRLHLDLHSIKEGAEYLRHHREIVRALYQSGQKSKLDFLNTENELIKLEEQRTAVNRELRKLQKRMAILTGRKPNELVDVRQVSPENLPVVAPLASLLLTASKNNPSLRIIHNDVEQLTAHIFLQKKANYPVFFIGNRFVVDHDPTAEGNFYTLYSGFSFPLFDWGVRKLKEDELITRRTAKQYETDAVMRYVEMKISALTEELRKQQELVVLREKNQNIAREASEYAEVSYQSGLSTNTDVLDTNRRLVDAGLRIDEARFEYMIRFAELEYTVGANLDENN